MAKKKETNEELLHTAAPAEETPSAVETKVIAVEVDADDLPEEEIVKAKESKKNGVTRDRRRLHYGAMATAVTAVVVIAAVVLNILVGVLNDRFPLNLDLTSNQMLTLSEKSETFAKGIDEEVEIHVFYDEAFFTAPNTGTKELDDLLLQFNSALQQYRSLSGGNVSYDFINLTSDPTAAAKYSKYEVEMGNVLFLSGERHAVAALDDLYTYDETSYYYYGQMVLTASEVEQVLAVNISKVLGSNLKPITMMTGHNESNSVIKTMLEKIGYEVVEKNITTAEEFNKDTGMVILSAPASDYTADEIKALREFLENGGKRGIQFVYIANYGVRCPNIEEYVKDNYGVSVQYNMITESNSSRHPLNYGYYAGTYAPYGDLQDSALTAAKELGVLMPLTLQLTSSWGSDTETAQYVQPVVTFPKSAQLIAMPDPSDSEAKMGDPTDAESYPVIGMYLSTAKEYYEGNTATTTALISGSYYFFADEKNEETVLALINGMNGVTETIKMPSKSFQTETATFGDDANTVYFLGLGVFAIALPLIFVIVGIVVFVKRRNL